MSVTLILMIAACLVAGCGKPTSFACSTGTQCVANGEQGTCAQGFCAFPDGNCASGFRFETNAGEGLAGSCTMATVDGSIDATTTCGAIDNACCAGARPCIGGATCTSGMCTACVADIALGRRFSCVRHQDSSVWCAGENTGGQLGNGVTGAGGPTREQARDVTTNFIQDASAVTAGYDHTCAIRAGGSVWCWGVNINGQLGIAMTGTPTTAARQVVIAGGGPLTNIVEIGAGYAHTCARDNGGGVWCWGRNLDGELGDGTTTARNVATPVRVAMGGAAFTGAVSLDVGGAHTCARKANNEAWCWGRNTTGALGDTTLINRTVPVMIATTTSIGTGTHHSCYVNADTSISCMGWSGHAHLGQGSHSGFWDQMNQATPVQVVQTLGGPAFTGAASVAIGGVQCALKTDTTVWCWGDNSYGQVGIGAGSMVPAQVRLADGTPLVGIDRLEAKFAHVCAHRTNGEWLCWGRNAQGDLGDGTLINRGFPTPLKASCP